MINQPRIAGTVLGVDLYHADTVDSWRDLYDAGVRVAILKLGEGKALDPTIADRFAVAESAGMKTATYWFVRPDVAPAIQSALIKLHQPAAKLFLDLEPSLLATEDRWLAIPIADRQAVLAALVSSYKTLTGGEHPGLYVTADFWESVLGAPDGYQACPWWGPRYGANEPVQPRNLGPWVGWQYTSNGTIPGLRDADTADLSVWRKEFWGIE